MENRIEVHFGKIGEFFTGDWKDRPFCYYRGAAVITFGRVELGTFALEKASDHQELVKACEERLLYQIKDEGIRESAAAMSGQGSAVHAQRIQGKNKGRSGAGKKPNPRGRK